MAHQHSTHEEQQTKSKQSRGSQNHTPTWTPLLHLGCHCSQPQGLQRHAEQVCTMLAQRALKRYPCRPVWACARWQGLQVALQRAQQVL
jgi:hypothetical protein